MRKTRAFSPQDREYYKEWIRAEFKSSRHEKGNDKIRDLISIGKRRLKVLENQLLFVKDKVRI